MPRTRRTAAPGDAAAADTAPVDAPDASPQSLPTDTTPQDTPTAAPPSEAAPKTRRARTPRAQAKTAPPTTVETEAPVVLPETDEAPAPKRRGGRRTAIATVEPEVQTVAVDEPLPIESVSAPDAGAPAPRRRGRGRRAAADTEISGTTVEALAAGVAEGTPQEETPPADEPTEAVKRRPGGRRRAMPEIAALAVELPDTEAPVAETTVTPSETAATPRRRRSRRRGEKLTPAETELPTNEAPPDEAEAGEAVAETETAEEGSKRSKRGRRSRRRRGDDQISADELLENAERNLLLSEPVEVIEEEEDLDDLSDLPLLAPAAPAFSAPPLVPPVLAPPDGAPLPRVRAHVQPSQGGGLARIAVNDQSFAPYFFFVNAETASSGDIVSEQIRQAAAVGIHLYSSVLYLPFKNAYGDRSFAATDALLQQILAADPDAFILPRLQFVPTNYWARTHPDQMARYADGSEGDASLASTDFWADCVDALEALIVHLANPTTPGGDRVIGFHLDRGEWFYDAAAGFDLSEPNQTAFQNWLHAKYQFPYALRAAWFNGAVTFEEAEIPHWPGATVKAGDQPLYSSPRDGRWPDFALFSSEIVADVITGLANAVKTLSEGRLLVGVSYGYTLEFATRSDSGHLALGRLLNSPNVDILAGPSSYIGRGVGSPGAFGAPIDSVGLRGKLWLVEDDTKTFLAGEETPDAYNPKISGGAETQAAHQRQFGAALAHRAGVTWMDLWGQGWLNHPEIWQELGRLRDQADRLSQIADQSHPAPDVIMLVDEASLAFVKNSPNGLNASLIGKTRDLLLRSGASVGFHLQSDVLRDDLPDAKLYLFVNALRLTTDERQAIRERLHRTGNTLVWLYAPGVFDERGLAEQEAGDTVGISLSLQPWNTRLGSQLTDVQHPLTERLRSGKRVLGQDEIINPSFTVSDPQATVLAEYTANGAPSLAVREHSDGCQSVFMGDPHLTAELLRGLYAYAGVAQYESQDDVLYAGPGTLTLHAPYTGQRTITLPRRATVYDVTDDKIIAVNAKSFRVFLRARTTRVFLWGTTDAITTSTGLTLPTGSADEPAPQEDVDASPRTSTRPQPRTPIEPPLSNRAPENTPRSTARQTGRISSSLADELALALDVLEEAILPILKDDEDEDSEETGEEDASSAATSAPRSRWQRRRAAMRARREAERLARAGGTPDGGDSASSSVDIAALLPNLPPRRQEAPASEHRDDAPED